MHGLSHTREKQNSAFKKRRSQNSKDEKFEIIAGDVLSMKAAPENDFSLCRNPTGLLPPAH